MNRPSSLLIALAFALLFSVGGLGCERPGDNARQDAGVAVDVALMAFLSQARALHHEANVREAENDLSGALRALERLTVAQRPEGVRPEVNEVLADTYARIAELRIRGGDLVAATRDIELGLGLAEQRTYFRGHLLEVAGILEEARASSLEDAGKGQEAAGTRTKAVSLLRQAVAIQEEVIRNTLPDAGPKVNPGERKP